MNQKTINSTHIGAASVMLIFLVLGLVSFAALTAVNSRADYILSRKMLDRSEAYYSACHEANAFIAETVSHIQRANEVASSEDAFYSLIGEKEFSRSFYISDLQTLDVTIRANYPLYSGDTLYTITSYRVVTHDEKIELDESLPVMK